MKMEIKEMSLGDMGLSREAIISRVKLEKLDLPIKGKNAELIYGTPEESAEKLAKILQSSGVI